MYKLHMDSVSNRASSVFKTNEDGTISSIPFDPANSDAAEFAKWLQDGNRPEPAEEGGTVTDEWVAETIVKLLPADEGEQA